MIISSPTRSPIGNIFIGKLHESVRDEATDQLRKAQGFDSILSYVKINGREIDIWSVPILLR